MGKVQSGILGGWYGKVGTVIGSFWKGIPLMREWRSKISNPNTDGQKLVRAKFALMGKYAGVLTPAINVGLKDRANKIKSTEQGEFVSINYGALTGTSPAALTVGWDEIQLSDGDLAGVDFGTPNFTTPLTVQVPITNANSDAPGANVADPIVVAVVCPDMKQAAFSVGVATRGDNSVTVRVPSMWQGMNVHVYGFTGSYPGAKNRNKVSVTAYVGYGNIS